MHKRKLMTRKQADEEERFSSEINRKAISDAQQVCGKVLLTKLSEPLEERKAPRAVDVLLLSAFEMEDAESGELLLKAWQALRERGFIKTAGKYDNFVGGGQVDLKRVLEIFGLVQ